MDDFGLWDVFVSMFWFMLLFAWIWLLISILTDIFRDRELGGGGKALWTIFLIFLPWLGALDVPHRPWQLDERAHPGGGARRSRSRWRPTSRRRRARRPA